LTCTDVAATVVVMEEKETRVESVRVNVEVRGDGVYLNGVLYVASMHRPLGGVPAVFDRVRLRRRLKGCGLAPPRCFALNSTWSEFHNLECVTRERYWREAQFDGQWIPVDADADADADDDASAANG